MTPLRYDIKSTSRLFQHVRGRVERHVRLKVRERLVYGPIAVRRICNLVQGS